MESSLSGIEMPLLKMPHGKPVATTSNPYQGLKRRLCHKIFENLPCCNDIKSLSGIEIGTDTDYPILVATTSNPYQGLKQRLNEAKPKGHEY